MPCYHPLKAWQLESGDIVFAERGKVLRDLWLPCSRCIGCRLERSRQWAVRCMHESQMHTDNMFITLTYDDDHVLDNQSLHYPHFQKFMKRLRRHHGKARFFMCGEYGERYQRPHYHACIFGLRFQDGYPWRKSDSGVQSYRSPSLEALWDYGAAEFGDVTFDSAAYVARYVVKKVNGPRAEEVYQSVDAETGEVFYREPEFGHMSLKPGIGATWYEKYKREVFPFDRVVINGHEAKPPRSYYKMLCSEDPYMADAVEYQRYLSSLKVPVEESMDARLGVREFVAKERLKSLKRGLE